MTSLSRLLLAAFVAACSCGCGEKARPWSGQGGPAAVLAPPASSGAGDTAEGTESTGARTDAAASAEPSAAASTGGTALLPAADVPPEAAPARAITPGGNWVKCFEGLALSGDPLKDVTRIGLLCGPSNGLRRKTRQAIVGVIGEHEPPVAAQLRVVRGACYRVIGVADAQVAEPDVTVRSSRDVAVAADHSSGRSALVQPDRPFCTFADDVFSIDFSARRGSGRFAAEIWAIGEGRRKADASEAPADEQPMDEP